MAFAPNWVFLIDENADFWLKRDLRAAGFTATHVHATHVGLGGFPDAAIFSYAKAHHLILLTIDQDFLDIHQYPPRILELWSHDLGMHGHIVRKWWLGFNNLQTI